MVKGVKCILDILGHGDVNMSVFVVPIQGHTTVQGAIPINGDGVVLLEGIDKMLGILLVGVLHAKVINAKGRTRWVVCRVSKVQVCAWWVGSHVWPVFL